MKPNILFLIIDSLRADKVSDKNGSITPNLDYIKKTSPYYILFKKELKLITDYERNIMNRANLLITVSKNDKNEIIYDLGLIGELDTVEEETL